VTETKTESMAENQAGKEAEAWNETETQTAIKKMAGSQRDRKTERQRRWSDIT
jgi:hypothetical protein